MDADILPDDGFKPENYQETDVFTWANNLVQYKDELKVELFFISKNYVLYKTALAEGLKKQLEPIFIDEMLEYILEGIDKGLIVRGFEEAEAEEYVLQRTQVYKVDKLRETLGWLKTQEHEIVLFKEDEHDINHMKGVLARVTHAEMPKPFYVAKVLPKSQVMKGKVGWMIRGDKFVPFDATWPCVYRQILSYSLLTRTYMSLASRNSRRYSDMMLKSRRLQKARYERLKKPIG